MHAKIFDIDGTLLQSAAVDDALYREAVSAVLGPVRLRPSLHAYDYVTDTGVLAQILEDNEIPVAREPMDEIRSYFVASLQRHIDENGPFVPVPGAAELLRGLAESSSHAVAIATGGWKESAELKLRTAGLFIADLPLASANDHHERTSIMEIALSQLGSSVTTVTYYGDGPWDREACEALGWEFVAVGSALGGLEDLRGELPCKP